MTDYTKLYELTKDLTVLLAEDFEPLRDEMKSVLRDFFKTVDSASDGREALQIYLDAYRTEENASGYDLVISDIRMPIMDGIELTKAIYKQNEHQPIIILSAHTETEYLLELINIGVAQFVTKPLQHSTLLEALNDVCGKLKKMPVESPEIDTGYIPLDTMHLWDKQKHQLKKSEHVIDLPPQEHQMLRLLCEQDEAVCTNQDIIDHFHQWGMTIEEENIRKIIFKLRKKLPENVVKSIYGLGYKLSPKR